MVLLSSRVVFTDFSGNICMLRAQHMIKYISGDDRISFSSGIYIYLNNLCLEQIPHKTNYSFLLKIVVYSFYLKEFLKVLSLI